MKKITTILLFTVITASCQDYGAMKIMASLPNSLKEVSGIEKFPKDNVVWAINDSRNPPEIYGYDLETSKIERVIRLKKATNIDWEDLASGPDSSLYVGDFGNNANNREDLVIYHIKDPSNLEKRRYEAPATTFRYEDQEEFPPKKTKQNFDVEAFVVWQDHFYLFTRNRAKNFDGTSKIYKIPVKEGDFIAEKIGEFDSCDDDDDCMITGADIHESSGKLALVSYNKVWIFSDFTGEDFTSGTIKKIKLGHTSQKESICFATENILLIADEKSHGRGGNLYRLDLDELQTESKSEEKP